MYNLSRSERTKNLHICILHQHILGVFNAWLEWQINRSGALFFFFFTKNLKLWCLWWHVKMSAVKKVLLNLTLKNWLCCYFLESHLVKFYMFIGEILVLYVSFWLVDLFQIYGHVFNLPHNPDWSVVMSFAWPLLWLVHTTLSHLGGVSLLSETYKRNTHRQTKHIKHPSSDNVRLCKLYM